MSVRSTKQRKRDVIWRLSSDIDLWVPSVTENGDAYIIPLSFAWVDGRIIMATPTRSTTARSLVEAGKARVAIGPTRDVVIVEGSIQSVVPESDSDLCDAHAHRAGFDARETNDEFVVLILTPNRIQTWRNPAELENRDVMREGNWLA